MQNIQNEKLTAEQRLFLDDFAALLAGWNMPNNAARVYGYMLFQNESASVDDMAAQLEMSRSNAFLAAKLLEGTGHLRRIAQPGSKRLCYLVREDFGTSFLVRTASLGKLGKLMEANAAKIATGAASERLAALSGFYGTMREGMERIIQIDTERAQESVDEEARRSA